MGQYIGCGIMTPCAFRLVPYGTVSIYFHASIIHKMNEWIKSRFCPVSVAPIQLSLRQCCFISLLISCLKIFYPVFHHIFFESLTNRRAVQVVCFQSCLVWSNFISILNTRLIDCTVATVEFARLFSECVYSEQTPQICFVMHSSVPSVFYWSSAGFRNGLRHPAELKRVF